MFNFDRRSTKFNWETSLHHWVIAGQAEVCTNSAPDANASLPVSSLRTAISGHSAGRYAAWFQTLNLDLEPVSQVSSAVRRRNISVAADYSIAFRTTRIC
jgi:hypothetical protein